LLYYIPAFNDQEQLIIRFRASGKPMAKWILIGQKKES